MRSWKGGTPRGTSMGRILGLRAWQNGKEVPIEINYDKLIWSGLSWAVGETKSSLEPDHPVLIQASSAESEAVSLTGAVYEVRY